MVRRHLITRTCKCNYERVHWQTLVALGKQFVGCPCLAELKSHMSTAIVADRCNILCKVYPSKATLKHTDSSAYISTCITAQKMGAHGADIFSPHLSVPLFFSPWRFSALLYSLPPWTTEFRMLPAH